MANGFEWSYNLSGGQPLILDALMKDTETLTRGDMLNVETGEVDLAVTSDAGLVGAFIGPEDPSDAKAGNPGVVEGTDSTTRVRFIANPDAVYKVTDANARNMGATLDISGTTGAQGVAASSNTEFVVVKTKRLAADKTEVMITPSAHVLVKT